MQSAIKSGIEEEIAARKLTREVAGQATEAFVSEELLEGLHAKMLKLAAEQKYEEAAGVRDEIARLKGQPAATPQGEGKRGRQRRRR